MATTVDQQRTETNNTNDAQRVSSYRNPILTIRCKRAFYCNINATVPAPPAQSAIRQNSSQSLLKVMGTDTRTVISPDKLPERFWGEAVCTAAYLQNRLLSRSISKTPFELWTGIKPNVDHIRLFGSKAYSYIQKQKRRKWDNKAREEVIVGYGGTTKGHRLLNPTGKY
ncbi:Copia protein [Trichinella patagoniensis]|uniref:Copia protein n=1 Tax=Trichinella patagoniensis TaxID=990121 RepID=A0A0V1AEI0_9BILA|nr:Copia protein [Trichinella patagoniensis]